MAETNGGEHIDLNEESITLHADIATIRLQCLEQAIHHCVAHKVGRSETVVDIARIFEHYVLTGERRDAILNSKEA